MRIRRIDVRFGSGAVSYTHLPPEDADDDRHQAAQIEVAPALHEDRVETRHDIFVVQSAYDGGQSRHRDTEYPDVVTEIDPFAAARTAQQEEREEGQHDAGPLAGVEPLAEDEHGADLSLIHI